METVERTWCRKREVFLDIITYIFIVRKPAKKVKWKYFILDAVVAVLFISASNDLKKVHTHFL